MMADLSAEMRAVPTVESSAVHWAALLVEKKAEKLAVPKVENSVAPKVVYSAAHLVDYLAVK